MSILFCCKCGAKVSTALTESSGRPRATCSSCGFVHYENPKIVAGCLVHHGDKVLLCRRAIEPRKNLWTIPAGFMECGESTRGAARRETIEEAGAEIEVKELFMIASLSLANHVYLLYRAIPISLTFVAGTESSEVKLFSKSEIPWDELAFHTVKLALEKFYRDYNSCMFSLLEVDF